MSDTQTHIYLEIPSELQQLLNDNGLSVGEILREKNVNAEVTYGVMPDELATDVRSKEPVMIVLATAALVLTVGSAISQVLHTLQRRPQLVEYYELVERRDNNGNMLLDNEGKPQLERLKKYELLEPRAEDGRRSLEISLNPANGFVIKFDSSERQMPK